MPRAFRAYPKHPAVNFLAKLHADLGGRIQANRKEAERLPADMKHVEAVIRMFDLAHNVRAILFVALAAIWTTYSKLDQTLRAGATNQVANQSFAGTSSRKVSISEIRPSRTRTTSTPLIGS
jgi:hypothetical protein